jgi:hypothetical protein
MAEGVTARRGVAVVVAYYAPPAVGIAVQRLRGFLQHLPGLGWDPVLIAPLSVHYHKADPEPGPETLPGVQVVRVPNPEPSRWLRRLAGAPGRPSRSAGKIRELRPVEVGRLGGRIRSLVWNWLYIPDAQALWIPGASRAAAAAVRSAAGRRTVLFSTSGPFSCHLAARNAAVGSGVPWVAEYRDPWSVAPRQFGHRPWLRQIVDHRLDHEVVSRADHLVVTSERTRTLFLDAFSEVAPATSVVRNGWDGPAGVEPGHPPRAQDPLALVYAGSLLKADWAVPFLEGVEAVVAREPGSVVLDVFGPREGWMEALVERGREAPFLRLHGIIPGEDVPGRLRDASALVVLQPDAEKYVPGKIYDYIGARRPVVADVPPGSEAEELLKGHGDLRSFAGRGAAGVEAVVRRLLAEHRAGSLAGPSASADVVEEMSRRAQTAVLADIFDRVVHR